MSKKELSEDEYKNQIEILHNIIAELDEKEATTGIKLTAFEEQKKEDAKNMLEELERGNQAELQRLINDSIELGEGIFPESKKKEIKEE